MNLNELKSVFEQNGCNKIYAKKLASNDNSKNQVYLGGSFEILNIFPVAEIISDSSGDWKRNRFKASLEYFWITEDKNLSRAPNAQFILYPKYPEVRFSGFLSGCERPPSKLMANRIADRILFLSPTKDGRILGYITLPESELAREFNTLEINIEQGVFKIINISKGGDNKNDLLKELKRIHQLGWIDSKKLDKNGLLTPCNSSNCGGYTLEAELGISPNGFSEPDFLGWEIKQFGVSNFKYIKNKIITLMTPEPNGGDYVKLGVQDFLRSYGYNDKKGREDRINFGGIHKIDINHHSTNLTLKLIGFDSESSKITNSDGRIALLTKDENEAASWSFSSLLKHWNRKHNQACYLPSLCKNSHPRKYQFANKALLGVGTDFTFFLNEMNKGHIYYDPGIKMEKASSDKPVVKRRSQFRIKSGSLINLYKFNEEVDLS